MFLSLDDDPFKVKLLVSEAQRFAFRNDLGCMVGDELLAIIVGL